MFQLKKWFLIHIILSILSIFLILLIFNLYATVSFLSGAFLSTLNIIFYCIFCQYILKKHQQTKTLLFLFIIILFKYCIWIIVIWQVALSVDPIWFIIGFFLFSITTFAFIPFLSSSKCIKLNN